MRRFKAPRAVGTFKRPRKQAATVTFTAMWNPLQPTTVKASSCPPKDRQTDRGTWDSVIFPISSPFFFFTLPINDCYWHSTVIRLYCHHHFRSEVKVVLAQLERTPLSSTGKDELSDSYDQTFPLLKFKLSSSLSDLSCSIHDHIRTNKESQTKDSCWLSLQYVGNLEKQKPNSSSVLQPHNSYVPTVKIATARVLSGWVVNQFGRLRPKCITKRHAFCPPWAGGQGIVTSSTAANP